MPIDTVLLQQLIDEASSAQTLFWEALRKIENVVGRELDLANTDLDTMDADSVLALLEADAGAESADSDET